MMSSFECSVSVMKDPMGYRAGDSLLCESPWLDDVERGGPQELERLGVLSEIAGHAL